MTFSFQAERADPSASSVLLVGVSTYSRADIDAVPAANDNLVDLADQFAADDLWGVAGPYNLMRSHDPTRSQFLTAIAGASKQADPGGLLLIYFAGHATVYDGGLFLCPTDGSLNDPATTMVAVEDIVRLTASCASDRKMLILDCCYGGNAAAELPGEALRAGEKRGWLLISASAGSPVNAGDAKHTAFTSALLEAFQGIDGLGRSLSPKQILEHCSLLLSQEERESDPYKPEPVANGAAWAEDPWLRNRKYIEPARPPAIYKPVGNQSPIPQPPYPGYRPWPTEGPRPYVGRGRELQEARRRIGFASVLPISGPRGVGKSAFVATLLAESDIRDRHRPQEPWLLLRLDVPARSGEEPLLQTLSTALGRRLSLDDGDIPNVEDRRMSLLQDLEHSSQGQSLLIVIDCSRLGIDPSPIEDALNDLLKEPLFERAAVMTLSRVAIDADGGGHLRNRAAVELAELPPDDACELVLLTLELEEVDTSVVDVDALSIGLLEPLLRFPGTVVAGVDAALATVERDSAGELDHEALIAGVHGKATAMLMRNFAEAGCVLWRSTEAGGVQPGSLAMLMAWSLSEGLPLREETLSSPEVGMTPEQTQYLTDCRILVVDTQSDQRWYELRPAARESLRTIAEALITRTTTARAWRRTPIPQDVATHLQLSDLGLEDVDRILAGGIKTLFLMAMAVDASDESYGQSVVEAAKWASGWLDDIAAEPPQALRTALSEVANAYAGDALFLPVDTRAEEYELAEHQALVPSSLRNLEGVYSAASGLAVAGHADEATAQRTRLILDAANQLEVSLAGAVVNLPPDLVRSLDTALYFASQRLKIGPQLVEARRAAVPSLLAGAGQYGPGRAARLTTTISWILNLAAAQAEAGQSEAGKASVRTAEQLLAELPDDGSRRFQASRYQYRQRIYATLARCADSATVRRSHLWKSLELLSEALRWADDESQRQVWFDRYLRMAATLARELESDADLEELLTVAQHLVEEAWVTPPTMAVVRLARFWVSNVSRHTEHEWRVSSARHAISLLKGAATCSPLEAKDLTTALRSVLADGHQVLSRSLLGLDRVREAIAEARVAEKLAASVVRGKKDPDTMLVWLRHLRRLETLERRGLQQESARDFRKRAREARRWLAQRTDIGSAHARLDCWILQSLWREEGSLAVAGLELGENFRRLPKHEKQARIDLVYRRRRSILNGHRRRYGESVEFFLLEARLEGEYARWNAVLSRSNVDNSAVLRIYSEAKQLWPQVPVLLEAVGRFYRYIWQYDEAVLHFDRLIATAQDGDTRRRGMFAKAECLLLSAQYDYRLTSSARRSRLDEAKEAVSELDAYRRRLPQVAILRDRVALELGESVDWTEIDGVYESVIGDDYSATVGRFLTARWYEARNLDVEGALDREAGGMAARLSPDAVARLSALIENPSPDDMIDPSVDPVLGPEDAGDVDPGSIGEHVLAHFTDIKILQGLGSLYLRRAELVGEERRRNSIERAGTYAQRAFGCFDACRILQEAWQPDNNLVIRFLQARAILAAVRYRRDLNPFPWNHEGAAASWGEYASRLLADCKANAVGQFGSRCSWEFKESRRLLSELSGASDRRAR